ncbi:MAG: hypothetical protein ACKO8N_00930 [Rubrivivax sp.]
MNPELPQPGLQTTVPISFRRRGGKAVIVLPDGSRAVGAPSMVIDNTMIKLVARAHRWQQLLLQGVYASIEELAQAEAINPSYVSRVMRLSCLAPSITEVIMEGQHPAHLTAKELLAPFPLAWAAQREHFKLG